MQPYLPLLSLVLMPCLTISGEEKELPLLLNEDFEKGPERWEATDAKAWKVIDGKTGKAYNQFQASAYKPPHRSPLNISLVKDLNVGNFVLEAEVQSTSKTGAHRDMCLFFGYQDSAHFYYVHIAGAAGAKDPNANGVFIVNAADRKKVSEPSPHDQKWDDEWHQVKIVRKVADGMIEIYFDDMKKPIMTAKDKTFTWGRVGIGSFDDSGNWDNVKLRGAKAAKSR